MRGSIIRKPVIVSHDCRPSDVVSAGDAGRREKDADALGFLGHEQHFGRAPAQIRRVTLLPSTALD